jgi:hypothetical protein
MAELEREMHCENCGSRCRIIYDSEQVHYDPETCPFCGEIVGTLDEEDLLDEEDVWGDELDGDDDANTNWN